MEHILKNIIDISLAAVAVAICIGFIGVVFFGLKQLFRNGF